jgi:hypothetical protein
VVEVTERTPSLEGSIMTRSASGIAICAMCLSAVAVAAPVEFSQEVDRREVGLEDTFRLTVSYANAPETAQLQLPTSDDVEVLSRSQATQMSFEMTGGFSGSLKRVHKVVLMMRPLKVGKLTIAPAQLTVGKNTYKTQPVAVTVRKGRIGPSPSAQRPNRPNNPLGTSPLFGFGDEEDAAPEAELPRSESDLFLRSHLDKTEAYVGEQLTLSLFVYSRIDLSEVTSLSLPKVEGFWSEDVDAPTQLIGENRTVEGVAYRAFLIRKRALFGMKPGTFTITPAEADVVTGFLFAGRKVHRVGNPLTVKVKPVPSSAAQAGNVGKWRLSAAASNTRVERGQPVTVKVTLEGQGNLHSVALPKLTGPASVRIFEPTSDEKMEISGGKVGGRKTDEYLVMPQQVGTVTLPPLSFMYFDPETARAETARTEPISLTVLPAGGAETFGAPPAAPEVAKMPSDALSPLRPRASFGSARKPIWTSPLYWAAVGGPLAAWAALGLLASVKRRMSHEDEGSALKRKTRDARRRLEEAEKLKGGSPLAFYGAVERALKAFLEAKLGEPVGGLLREALLARMRAKGVRAETARRIITLLDQCDMARFGGGAAPEGFGRVIEEAASAMEGWDEG